MAEKVPVNADKLKVLDAVMQKIEKDFGKGSIMRMNSTEVNDIPVIPTGSITLDMALGVGGYPKGRVIEIYGPESSGKTTLAIHCHRRGTESRRHRRIHRRRTRLRQLLRPEIRCRCRQPAHLAARQRRTGPRNRRFADPFERHRHHRHRLRRRTHAQGRNRRRNGRFEDGPPGPPHVPGPAETHIQHLQDQGPSASSSTSCATRSVSSTETPRPRRAAMP